jgi:hypothetical protein
MNPTICRAIREHRVLELRYHDYSRIVEPHIHGEDKRCEEVLRCYQLAGGSESGEQAGWKMLKVREAKMLHPAETGFLPRADTNPHDRVIDKVFCRVNAPAQQKARSALPAQEKNQSHTAIDASTPARSATSAQPTACRAR